MTRRKIERVEEEVTLVLSFEEANALLALCGSIGGDPKGPRGTVDALQKALSVALGYGYIAARALTGPVTGSVHFPRSTALDAGDRDE